jgi:hypothetical protein
MTTARCSPDLYGACASTNVGDQPMNENFSLIVMCLFLLGSLAFLAQQLTSYH